MIDTDMMMVAGATEWFLGMDDERRSLEDVATPLTAEDAQDLHASAPAGSSR